MGHATAIYTNGSTCLKNSNFQNRARIIFVCDSEAGVGEPILLTEDDECYFIFEWRTSIVCPEKPTSDTKFTSCNYTDNSKGIYFNLLPLQKAGIKPYYEVTDGNSSYLLNVCATLENSNLANCKDAGVCKTEGNNVNNYGIAASQKITYDGRRFRLTFYDGDDCPSGFKGKLTSEVLFVCNPLAGVGEPVVHKKYTCLTVFLWETSLSCQKMQDQCAFDIDGNHYDFNLLSSLSHNWNTSDSKNMTYYINLCRGIQQTMNTFGCSPTAAVCMVDPNGFHLSLGMVETMKVKLFNATDLLLTFESGDSRACSTVNSDKKLKPVTRLFMRCGSKLGHPRIFSGPDDKCFYDFVWESSLACADLAVKVMLEKDGIIKDPRFDYSLDITDILNRTFIVNGSSVSDQYVYKINLNGTSQDSSDAENPCSKAAVCQTKPHTDFMRDIGSIDSRTFVVRGSELHLTFVSQTRPCGKNRMKNVTTIINLQCVSASGIGNPVFFYESGDCDYIFDWETIVVCPDFHKRNPHIVPSSGPKPDPFKDEEPSSHKAEIAVGVIFTLIILMVVAFILVKPTRRAVISSRFRSLFSTANLPYFRYKRGDILTELQSDF
ncbi:cation-independent mannose-6-phosphate receptor-like isoform X3 [Stegodyphus dumicola]|uniref:cation-independent mannose-6-phosphate receptor-like isoform X3 n=1 Tax=Stegodyphus dumicola TaxID=202533 RepID=UPI0015AAA466|nr:cation-independent mannose-6-phosphate receptor-like isoform X3 [Stegodyphus dumicola]